MISETTSFNIVKKYREGRIDALDDQRKSNGLTQNLINAHRVKTLKITEGIHFLFLPPYDTKLVLYGSPEFNPIELAWNTIKTFVRSKRPRTFQSLETDFLYVSLCY